MVEIKTLKELLLAQDKALPEQIVEVHSAYSEELYDKLFKSKIKQKIIIATNIG
jgi:HrpA-like RNA helicase